MRRTRTTSGPARAPPSVARLAAAVAVDAGRYGWEEGVVLQLVMRGLDGWLGGMLGAVSVFVAGLFHMAVTAAAGGPAASIRPGPAGTTRCRRPNSSNFSATTG